MKKSFFLLSLLLLMIACKPTEKNYKAAYDAALGKREAVAADLDIPIGSLQQVDGPQLKEVDGVKVYVMHQRLKSEEDSFSIPGPYNVAVGTYKMNTNCISQANALKDEGLQAFPAKDTEGIYYTIAGSFLSLSDAVEFYKIYQSGKNRVYVGLPSAPVIIFSPNNK